MQRCLLNGGRVQSSQFIKTRVIFKIVIIIEAIEPHYQVVGEDDWEKVKLGDFVSDNRFGLTPGRSMTKAIHLIRSLMELYRERKNYLHKVFIDLKKAYDRVPHEVIWECLEKKEALVMYTWAIKDIYNGVKMRVRASVGDTEDFFHWYWLSSRFSLKACFFSLFS